MTSQKKNILILSSAAAFLVAVYMILVFFLPRLPIWSVRTYDKEETPREEVTVSGGEVFTRDLDMPYDYLSGVQIIWNTYDSVTKIDGTLEITDSSGNVIAEKTITSNYDCNIEMNCIRVSKGEECHLKVTVDDVTGPDIALVVKSEDMSPCIVMTGHNDGAEMKSFFGMIYLFFSIAFLLLVYSVISGDRRKDLYEKTALGLIILISVLGFSQYFDLLIIMKGALMIDGSLMQGHLFSYYDDSYTQALSHYTILDTFGFNYDFFLMAPVALLLFPISFFIDPFIIGNGEWFLMLILISAGLLLLVLVSARYMGKIGKVCGLSEEQSENARKMFMFSPLLIYITFFYGQIDILYITVFIIAFYF